MSLHTSINKIWIFFSWPWKRTLKDWIEKVTAWLTPFERKVKGPAPNQWTADFSLLIDWTSHHACRVKCSPSELKKKLIATKKKLQEQTEESDELMKSLNNPEQYTRMSRKHSIEIHGIPENVYTSNEYAVPEVAEALNVPVVVEDILETAVEISHKLKR